MMMMMMMPSRRRSLWEARIIFKQEFLRKQWQTFFQKTKREPMENCGQE
jgi:hypothetical protein